MWVFFVFLKNLLILVSEKMLFKKQFVFCVKYCAIINCRYGHGRVILFEMQDRDYE
jgi:hypothetical protein